MGKNLIYWDDATGAFAPVPSSDANPDNPTSAVTSKKEAKDLWDSVGTKAPITTQLTGTLSIEGWSTGNRPPYTQSVTINGINVNMSGVITVATTANSIQFSAAASALMRPTAQAANTITVVAQGNKPSVAIPIVVTIYGALSGGTITNGFPGGSGVTPYSEIDLCQFKRDVTVYDTKYRATTITFKRSDNTLFMSRVYSNANANGYYQTCIEKFYAADGTTLVETHTYALTYLVSGIIDTISRTITVA